MDISQIINFNLPIIIAEGGLFDFNATLPLMALQLLFLMILLNAIFYKPILQVLDKRDDYIRSLSIATQQIAKANELDNLYQAKLTEARQEAELIISKTKMEAQKTVEEEMQDVKIKVEKLAIETYKQLNIQQEKALSSLETQIDQFIEQIQNKILNF
uniref:ATP synthase CFO B' subunit subunit II n=1 Tax=Glaucosphaera vacuolata TaxID=38265 RepID=UPI001FCCF86A|nr:ATP synthase CFO B' subunit subunit II [Glaucosphaera vacuolata]UNJ18665.1 ATP synthase CFO B' subunit subunit II [Glaucosphaera vacuolata]